MAISTLTLRVEVLVTVRHGLRFLQKLFMAGQARLLCINIPHEPWQLTLVGRMAIQTIFLSRPMNVGLSGRNLDLSVTVKAQ